MSIVRRAIAAILCAGVTTVFATSPASGQVPRHGLSCVVGDRGDAPFCGATVGGPSAVICALPGAASRNGFMGVGKFAARLADSSIIEGEADPDSATAVAVAMETADPVAPCAMRISSVIREWRTTGEALARLRFSTIVAQIDASHGASAAVQCGTPDSPRQSIVLRRVTRGGGVLTLIDLAAYRSTDGIHAQFNALAAHEIVNMKVVLGQPTRSPADTGAVRTRYVMRVLSHQELEGASPALGFGFQVDSGLVACERMVQAAYGRMGALK